MNIYHVTFTKHLPSILLGGIMPFQTTNWVRTGDKSRYGAGEIYAFTEQEDAVRWAAKMDWQFNQEMGSGEITILTAKRGDGWQIDDADPLTRLGSKGDWLKRMNRIPPADILEVAPVTPELIREATQRQKA
jgi:hypothetical protein